MVSLSSGVFSAAGAGVKANIIFFEKGSSTEEIWYYDLSDIKVGPPLRLTGSMIFSNYCPKKRTVKEVGQLPAKQ
jgi:hypothetical protein